MATSEPRTTDDVLRDLAAERAGLASDVEELRTEGDRIRSKIPQAIAATVGVVIAMRAAKRLLRR
jgi:hypothetical protein